MKASAILLVAISIPVHADDSDWRLLENGDLVIRQVRVQTVSSCRFFCSAAGDGKFLATFHIALDVGVTLNSTFLHADALNLARTMRKSGESFVIWGDRQRSVDDYPLHSAMTMSVPVKNFAEVWPQFLAGCYDD